MGKMTMKRRAAVSLLALGAAVCLGCSAALLQPPTASAEEREAIGATGVDLKTVSQDSFSRTFTAYYSADNGGMSRDELSNWTLGADGAASKTYSESGGSPWLNNSFLKYNSDEYYRYFEATAKFTVGAQNDNSYTGLFFGLNNVEETPKTSKNAGGHVYITNWGHLYLEGYLFNEERGSVSVTPQANAQWDGDKYKNDANDAGAAFENADSDYWFNTNQKGLEHTLVLRVTDNRIEIKLDPSSDYQRTLTYTVTNTSAVTFGDVGLYASNQSSVFSYFGIKPLNADGTDMQTEDETGLTTYSFAEFDSAKYRSYQAPADGSDWNTYERAVNENWSVDREAAILRNTTSLNEEVTEIRQRDSLVLGGIKYESFEIEARFKFSSWSSFAGGRFQSVGFDFGWNNFTRSAAYGENTGGGIAYLNNDGHMNLAAHLITSSNGTNGRCGGTGLAEGKSVAYDAANQVVRNVSDDSVNPWWGTENWNIVHVLKLRVTKNKIELVLDEGTALSRSVWYQFNDDVNGIVPGSVAIFASNQSVSFLDGVKLRYLDENGDPMPVVGVESISLGSLALTQEMNTSLRVVPEISPANATFKDFKLSSDNENVVKVIGDVLLFVGAGEAKITATSVYDSLITQETTVTVTEKDVSRMLHLDLSSEESLSKLSAYYQEGGNSADVAISEELGAHWSIEDGVITRINDLGGGDVAATYAELYLNRTFQSFEVSFMMKASSQAGWAGVMFGKTNYSSFFDQGDAAYIATHDSKATFWGQTIGSYSDEGNEAAAKYYVQNDWNYVKLQVYGTNEYRTVKFYVNDMTTPVLTSNRSTGTTAGKVCLFTTSSEVSFQDINFNYLTSDGEVIPYVATTEIRIANKIETAQVGDEYVLSAASLPENGTNSGISYLSTNTAVASVTENGAVSFHSAGTVVIRAVSQDDPEIYDEVSITVTARLIQSISISDKITTARVGDTCVLRIVRTPADAMGDYQFETSDSSVATVSATGVVSFVGEGEVTITVKSADNATVKDTMTVSVAKADQTSNEPEKGSPTVWIAVGVVAIVALLAGAAALVVIKGKKNKAEKENDDEKNQ